LRQGEGLQVSRDVELLNFRSDVIRSAECLHQEEEMLPRVGGVWGSSALRVL
jgi:hypothetical protein